MQFISNDKIDSVFKTLLNKDFNVDNISTINNMKFNGDKIKYGYVSKFIKDIDPDKRDILLTNTELCIKLSDMLEFNDTFMQILNHIILEVPRATELDFVKEQTQRYSQQNRDFRKMQREFSVKIEDFGNEFEKIKEILAEQLDADPEEMTMDTKIAEDLEADSLDVVELLMSIEDEFEVEIPDEEIENLKTIGDVVEYIQNNMP